MALTNIAIKAAKPAAKMRKLSDGGGLQLWAYPNASKLWRLAYRFEGKQKLLALGAFPRVSLMEARQEKEAAKRLLSISIDPSAERKAERRAKRIANADTFNAVADEYIAKAEREGRAGATMAKLRWLIELSRPDLGRRPVAEISPPEILDVLRKVEVRGKLETARRLRATLSAIFRYSIATARLTNDPSAALRGALTSPVVKHRAAITNASEFGKLLQAIDRFDGHVTVRIALQLLALTAVRPGELRFATWDEFDLDGAVWTIPPGKTKMRRPHLVPLAHQSIALIGELKKQKRQSVFLFPSVRSVDRPMSENTFNAALRRLGFSKDSATAHGFRSTFSTLANESGEWSYDGIERALAHVDSDDVRRAYHRGAHWEERVALAQWYADLLDKLRNTHAETSQFGREE